MLDGIDRERFYAIRPEDFMRFCLFSLPHIEEIELEQTWHAHLLFLSHGCQVVQSDDKGVVDHTRRRILYLVL